MAQAANFTITTQNKPSLFEIIAQNSLNETLYPALQRVALFLANNFPDRILWLSEYYDEVFLTFNALLQYYYLRKHDASFAENFYALKRVSLESKSLTEKQRQLSLLTLALLPYLRRKLEDRIAVYKIQRAEGSLRNNLHDNFKKFLIHVHSASHLTWGLWTVINYLRYMSNKTGSQLPMLHLLKLRLLYSGELQDANFWSELFRGRLGLSEVGAGLARNAVGSALELTAFFMQFLQVWNAERLDFSPTAFPVVRPPDAHQGAKQFARKCPICLQSWKIPTVLPVSGYVFCFPCILRHLRENQSCPVTNLPAKSLDIIRLYDS